jgi:type IV fimbrial biogenesis protein FimT
MEPMMRQRGFTIIEVVITVTIAAFLLAALMPSIGTWMRNSRLRTAAESISNGLQQARNEAVRRNQPISFFLVSDVDAISMSDGCALSASGSGWVVAPASPAGRCATDRDTFVSLRVAGDTANGLSVSATDNTPAAATTVTFNGYGQISNASAISCIKLTNASDTTTRKLNIAVNAGGQIRMCDPAVSDLNDPRVCPPPPPGVAPCQ